MNQKLKWLTTLVVVLIITNIALVAFIWLHKDGVAKPPRGDARNYLVKELQLNEKQEKSFDSLRSNHFEKIDEYSKKLLFVKDRLFHMLSEKDSDQVKQALAIYLKQKLGELQANIDMETFEHFSKLRSLLDEEQKKKFDNTIQEVLRTMGPRPPGNEGPPSLRRSLQDPPPNSSPEDKPPIHH